MRSLEKTLPSDNKLTILSLKWSSIGILTSISLGGVCFKSLWGSHGASSQQSDDIDLLSLLFKSKSTSKAFAIWILACSWQVVLPWLVIHKVVIPSSFVPTKDCFICKLDGLLCFISTESCTSFTCTGTTAEWQVGKHTAQVTLPLQLVKHQLPYSLTVHLLVYCFHQQLAPQPLCWWWVANCGKVATDNLASMFCRGKAPPIDSCIYCRGYHNNIWWYWYWSEQPLMNEHQIKHATWKERLCKNGNCYYQRTDLHTRML